MDNVFPGGKSGGFAAARLWARVLLQTLRRAAAWAAGSRCAGSG
jgi:hypothetical protein